MTAFSRLLKLAAIPATGTDTPERSKLLREPHYERRRNLLFDKHPNAKYTEWMTGIDLYGEYPQGIITIKEALIGRQKTNRVRVSWLCDDIVLLMETTGKLMMSPHVRSGDFAAGFTGLLSSSPVHRYERDGDGPRMFLDKSETDSVVDELLDKWKEYGLSPDVRSI